MAQVESIIRDALGHLGVIDADAAVTEIDMRDAIRALNLMARAWEANGLTMGWSDVAAGTDTLPAPPEAEEALGYNLAVRLRARYRVVLEGDVIALARDGLATLSAQVVNATFEELSYPDLPSGEGRRSGNWYDGYNH